VVLASGGYQGNLEWLKASWGPPAENFIIRAPPTTRRMLRVMLDQGRSRSATAAGPCRGHRRPAPKFDGGIVNAPGLRAFGSW